MREHLVQLIYLGCFRPRYIWITESFQFLLIWLNTMATDDGLQW